MPSVWWRGFFCGAVLLTVVNIIFDATGVTAKVEDVGRRHGRAVNQWLAR